MFHFATSGFDFLCNLSLCPETSRRTRPETSWKRTQDASFGQVPRSSSRPPQPSIFHWHPWTLTSSDGAARVEAAHLGSQHSEARERGGSQIQGQRGLHSESLSNNNKKKKTTATRKLDKNKKRWRTSGKLGCKQVR